MTHTPNTPARAFIYARISEDRDGRSSAPERQVADARALIEREGLIEAGEPYVDRDLSASDPSVTRPEFERLLIDAARSGGVIVAQDQDRLLRQPADAERVIALGLRGVQVRTVRGDTGSGMLGDAATDLMVRIKAAMGGYESAQISARIRRKHRAQAEAGVGHGSRYRPFGHDRAFQVVDAEAAIVREVAERYIAGESISALCRDLNARGITTTSGAPWRHQPMRSLLGQARLAGARELAGELIATGAIEPIISVEQLAELRATLALPRRSGTRSNARRHLLSGFLYCGNCGERMIALPQARGMRYACPLPSNQTRPGCGRVAVSAAPVERLVRAWIIDTLQLDRLAELAADEDADAGVRAAMDELREVDQRTRDLDADYADGVIDRKRYRSMLDRLAERRARAEALIGEATRSRQRADLPLPALAEAAWDNGDLHERRDLIDALISRVVIERATRRGRVFDPERVAIIEAD